MAPNRRRKPIALKPGQDPASLPLKHPPRELFAQAVARGVNVDVAYREAGYTGGPASRRELRCAADVDARIRWLLVDRIESDAKVRARLIEKEHDAKMRLVRQLEAIAYSDLRDVVQWDREPTFDGEGNVIGWKERVELTPSRLLTQTQAAQVKAVTVTSKRDGKTLKIEAIDRMTALAQLAKIFGLTASDAPAAVNNTQVNVAQVNVSGETNALEAMRRLAFAIEKAARAKPLLEATATDAPDVGPQR